MPNKMVYVKQSSQSLFSADLFRIIRQCLVGQRDVLRTLVGALVDKPPDGNENGQATSHQTGIVHVGSGDLLGEGEAENDDKGKNIDTGQSVDDVTDLVVHKEVSRNERRAAGHDVREDSQEVRQTGQLHEATNKGAESSSRAEVYAGQDGDYASACQSGVEGVAEGWADASKPAREGGSTVAGDGPQCAAGGDIAARGGNQGGQEGDNQETKSTASGSGSLLVDRGQGEVVRGTDDRGKVIDGVEDSDHVEDTSDETDSHLGKDSLGDVTARPKKIKSALVSRDIEEILTWGSPQPSGMNSQGCRHCRHR